MTADPSIYVFDLSGRVWSIPTDTRDPRDVRDPDAVIQQMTELYPTDFPYSNELTLLPVEDTKLPDEHVDDDEKASVVPLFLPSFMVWVEPLPSCLRWESEHAVFRYDMGCPHLRRYKVSGAVTCGASGTDFTYGTSGTSGGSGTSGTSGTSGGSGYHYVTHAISLTTMTHPISWAMKIHTPDDAVSPSRLDSMFVRMFVGVTFLVNRFESPYRQQHGYRNRFGWMVDQDTGYVFTSTGQLQMYPGQGTRGRQHVLRFTYLPDPSPCLTMDGQVLITQTKRLWRGAPCHLHVAFVDSHSTVETVWLRQML